MADDDLDAVYASDGAEATTRLYDRWADDYDDDMARLGYRHPAVAVALLARHLPATQDPVLDAGSGTGQVGELLSLLGYGHLEALDLSEQMLARAAERGVYRELHCASLDDRLPFADDHFAAAVAVGVFTTGHVSLTRVTELVRVVRPGGVVVFTVKDEMADALGAQVYDELLRSGQVRSVERTSSYLSMPGHATSTLSHACALTLA